MLSLVRTQQYFLKDLKKKLGHENIKKLTSKVAYHKVASSNTSRLEAHAGFFRLLMKGIFNPYELRPFDKKFVS